MKKSNSESNSQTNGKIRFSIKMKILVLLLIVSLPCFIMIVYLINSIGNYSKVYDKIVSDMALANNYNLNFKEEMDESLYKLVVGYVTFDNISENEILEDPYELIGELRDDFSELRDVTTDPESKVWLQSLLRNLDTLERRVDDIVENTKKEGTYDENIEQLDNNIYILTELIQDDIQYYIYYQTRSMEAVNQSLNQQLREFTFLCNGIIAGMIIILTVTAVLITTGIIRPVRDLYKATLKIAKGDFTARAEVHSRDEVEVLAQGFNYMAGNIQTMVTKIREDERKMRKAELRLLQEQINPHFLYNTLDTIVWLIEKEENDKAVEMVVTLSNFFRQVLSRGKEFITVKEEKEHIESYLKIQEVRYQDVMEYHMEIDPQVYDYEIPKLTMQPIVENALYHGLKCKRGKGYIRITGEEKGGKICLTVTDNGAGMEEQELEELQKEIQRPCKETERGFGLANVNERIRMYFGKDYGLRLRSQKDRGTVVEIVIPAVKEENRLEKREEQ